MHVLSSVLVRISVAALPGYGCCVRTNRTSGTVAVFKRSCPGRMGFQVSSWGGGINQDHKLAQSRCDIERCEI